MLPFSTDWFMSWQPNIHASLFMALYRFVQACRARRVDAIVQAYRLYNDHIESFEMEQVLSLTRAWT
jgi:flagellar transcriptional activator FlhC